MNKIVYINIPAGDVAGGVEALFQLADAINNVGGKSVVIWDRKLQDPIPNKYKNYNIIHSEEVEDSSNNWIIYPEVWTEKIHDYSNLKKFIWWLSVDNNHNQFQDFQDENITHFYQSYYAQDFLSKKGAKKILPLFDYLSSYYFESSYTINEKENIVCYNPAKGIEITNEIRSLNPEINFIPIISMNENEIIQLLKISKVYIDFGHHPGRDRIPREAAILGNCILTNEKGSAGFYTDLPFDSEFKTNKIEEIGTKINICFNEYENYQKKFYLYRSVIQNQKEQFFNLCKQYFT
jgi:hypothetical protein